MIHDTYSLVPHTIQCLCFRFKPRMLVEIAKRNGVVNIWYAVNERLMGWYIIRSIERRFERQLHDSLKMRLILFDVHITFYYLTTYKTTLTL